MKNLFTFLVILLGFVFIFVNENYSQIHVKMRVNTSTNRDTLQPYHFVQLRGEVTGTIVPSVTWDQNSGIILTNVGGDYWEANFQITPGSVLKYKFWTGFSNTDGTFFWDGWEGPLTSPAGGGNRQFVAGTSDTVVTLQFYNGNETEKTQYWRPYQIKPDSVAIYFRVNMAGITQAGVFDPNVNGPVGVRGNVPLNWDTSRVLLTKEIGSVNGESFWSGVVYVPKTALADGQEQQFKFVIEDITRWEDGIPNRTFYYSNNMINLTGDTTIHWYYFQDIEPFSGTQVTATITWRLKLEAMESMGLFDRGLGDKIIILGPLGWAPETDGIEMTFVPALQEWIGQQTFTKYPGEEIIYKYYIAWDTSRVNPSNPNYIPGLFLTDGWEEPGFTGGSNRSYIYTDQTQQNPEGDFGYDQQFFNSIPPEGVITTPITINFNIDMTNAADPDSNAANTLFRPGIDTAYIQFDGSVLPLTQGLTMWGTDNRIMLDDSDGDLIYTGSMMLDPVSCYQACYRIVYTSTTGEVWNGGGVQYGRRYYQFVHPTSINPVSWPSTFDFPVMPWRASNLIVEAPPTLITSADDNNQIPLNYEVSQNYPNPFNPSTTIKYSIPNHSLVQIRVYDITGSLVKTLLNSEQSAGRYEVVWNGKDGSDKQAATGIYFMQFRAGGYSNTIKMMLLK